MKVTRAALERLERKLNPILAGIQPDLSPQEAEQRQAARDSLLEFTQQTHHDYQPGWHHALLCRRLEKWAATPDARLIVVMPPRHGKSELVSRRLPAWLLGRDPDTSVMLCSYGARLANRLNRNVQQVIDGKPYQGIFPAARISRKGAGGGAVRKADHFETIGRRGSLTSSGASGGITGLGFNFGIIDDPVKNRQDAESTVIRDRMDEWYTSTFYTRRAAGARILLTMTRWHEDDLAGRLLQRMNDDPKADKWEVLHLPAIADGVKREGDPRAEGEALWPEQFPLSDLEKIRAQSEYDWWALYQGDPRQGGHTEWPVTHFGGHVWFSDWPEHLPIKAVAVDPSKGSDSKPGDYCAILAGGYDGAGGLWVEAYLARLSPEAIVTRTVDVFEAWPTDLLAVETNMFQELLCAPMLAEGKQRGLMLPIYQVENWVNKQVRIRRLGPHLAAKNIHIRATPGGRLLVDQLRKFPLAEHDDGPDCLEMLQRVLIDLWNGKKGKR